MAGAEECVSRVQVSLEANDLPNKDVLSLSDPFAILYVRFPQQTGPEARGRQAGTHGVTAKVKAMVPMRKPSNPTEAFNKAALDCEWTEMGRTETVDNCLDPKFQDSFEIAYFFEKKQEIRVELYDRDAKSDERLARHDPLGAAELSLAELVAAPGQRLTIPLSLSLKHRPKGTVTLLVEEVATLKRAIELELVIPKIKSGVSIFGGPVFLRIWKSREGGEWVVVYSSKKVTRNKKSGYVLDKIKLSSQKLNNGDANRPLLFEVLSFSPRGAHVTRGSFETTESRLLKLVSQDTGAALPGSTNLTFTLNKKTTGELRVRRARSTQVPTFLDYIFGGCEVNLLTAIDFTASNGDPRRQGTLHYNDPTGPNEYEAAIRAVTHILAPYDADQLIPSYGYGAKLPPNHEVSHCFALNGDPASPECFCPDGVLDAYRRALNTVILSGPTNFSQILSLAASSADKNVTQESQKYTILLIITDGIISDMEASIAQIVLASSLPLSIVIVGVGESDFGAMERLDADGCPLVSAGTKAKRDIVQFVPFRNVKGSPGLLAEQVLAEIPDQLLSFMEASKIRPNPPTESAQLAEEQNTASIPLQPGASCPSQPLMHQEKAVQQEAYPPMPVQL